MEKGKLIFVTGGVRSGKSGLAETMAVDFSRRPESNLHYIACGVSSDKEMAARIARHKNDRANSSVHWETWECPHHLTRIADHFTKQDVLVLDCVTTLLNNYLFGCKMVESKQVLDVVLSDISSLQEVSATLIVVSNEVSQGLPFVEPAIRNYQYILGNVHQKIVSQADTAYLVENGIPICKKGAAK